MMINDNGNNPAEQSLPVEIREAYPSETNNHLKLCTKCHIEKSVGQFHICKTNKDGRRGSCKKCDYERAVKWKENNLEKVKASQSNYWEKNKKEIKVYAKLWREKNRTKINKLHRNLKNRYSIFKSRAKQKGYDFSIKFQDFENLLSKKCFYDGAELNETGCALDRIDSSKGYTLENVVPCCKKCNTAKSDMPQKEFIELCFNIVKKYLENNNTPKKDI